MPRRSPAVALASGERAKVMKQRERGRKAGKAVSLLNRARNGEANCCDSVGRFCCALSRLGAVPTLRVETGLLSSARELGHSRNYARRLGDPRRDTHRESERERKRELTPDMPWDTGSFGRAPTATGLTGPLRPGCERAAKGEEMLTSDEGRQGEGGRGVRVWRQSG